MKYLAFVGIAAMTMLAATSPASAGGSDSKTLYFQLPTGETRTFFIAGSEQDTAAYPVFRVCFNRSNGNQATLLIHNPRKGIAQAVAQALPSGGCLFVSGQALTLRVETAPEGADVTTQTATRRAEAWLAERVEALRAMPERSEADTALLKEFERRLDRSQPSSALTPGERQSQMEEALRRIAELNAKPELTDEERIEFANLQIRLNRISDDLAHFTVTLVRD